MNKGNEWKNNNNENKIERIKIKKDIYLAAIPSSLFFIIIFKVKYLKFLITSCFCQHYNNRNYKFIQN
jgi:hypothetical protein